MTLQRYRGLFDAHGLWMSDIYMLDDEKRHDAIFALFDEVSDEMVKPSPLNGTFPGEFVGTMRRYNAGDIYAVTHFDNVSHRAFYLSDLYDILQLIGLGRF